MKNFERERTERVSEEQKEKKDQQERIWGNVREERNGLTQSCPQ